MKKWHKVGTFKAKGSEYKKLRSSLVSWPQGNSSVYYHQYSSGTFMWVLFYCACFKAAWLTGDQLMVPFFLWWVWGQSLFLLLTIMLTPHPRLGNLWISHQSHTGMSVNAESPAGTYLCWPKISLFIPSYEQNSNNIDINQQTDLHIREQCFETNVFLFQNIDLSCACYRSPMSKTLRNLSWL